MGVALDLTNQRFGKLTACRRTDEKENGYHLWECRCDCGGRINVSVRKLKRGTVTKCKTKWREDVEVEKHVWNSGVITQAPTCTTGGEKILTCHKCGQKKTEQIHKQNHRFGTWTSADAEAHQRVCSNGHTHVERKPHKWEKGTIVKTATQTEAGRLEFKCADCGAVRTETIPPLVAGMITMHRVYNPDTHEHLHTKDENEVRVLTNERGWNYEGSSWGASETSGTPAYRLFNKRSGEHFYTKDAYERSVLHWSADVWNDEGIGWYSDDAQGVAVYRLFNADAGIGAHHNTTDEYERGVLIRERGWTDEGVAWYGVRQP